MYCASFVVSFDIGDCVSIFHADELSYQDASFSELDADTIAVAYRISESFSNAEPDGFPVAVTPHISESIDNAEYNADDIAHAKPDGNAVTDAESDDDNIADTELVDNADTNSELIAELNLDTQLDQDAHPKRNLAGLLEQHVQVKRSAFSLHGLPRGLHGLRRACLVHLQRQLRSCERGRIAAVLVPFRIHSDLCGRTELVCVSLYTRVL